MSGAHKNATGPAGTGGAKQTTDSRDYNATGGNLARFNIRAAESKPARPRLDFDAINAAALGSLPTLVARWLPDGKRRNSEWVAINPTRNDTGYGSFSVNLSSGKWADFATGDKGGDPVSLAAYLFNMRQSEAAREIAQMLGVSNG